MKVSVIIPVHNAAPFLDKSIQSALVQKQTGEVLLIDDRSTDDSLEICKRWELKDSRVKVFVNEGTKGAGAARNVGLRHATCDYIAFLDADDYYLEGRFEDDYNLFVENNDIEVVANALSIITLDKNKSVSINSIYEHQSILSYKPSFSKIKLKNFVNGNSFSIISLTIRRDVFQKVGYFDESLKQCQDTDMNLRLMLNTNIYSGNAEKPVVVYLRHNNNTTKNDTEAVNFRRKASKKHFRMAFEQNLDLKNKWKFLKNFIEYDYLWIFGKNLRLKKFYKAILLPLFIYRLISKTDPDYDKNRKILPS